MTDNPVRMPSFSLTANSASVVPPFWQVSMNVANAGCVSAACAAKGCSAATAQNVTPMMVSGRVVNTYILPS